MSKRSKPHPPPAPPASNDGDGESAGDRRTRLIWTVVAVIMVVAALGALGLLATLLIGAGSSSPGKDVMACVPDRDFTATAKEGGTTCPPKGAPYVDGLIQDVTDTGFDLVTIDGDRRSYGVREPDRPYIDVQHAESHASLGQPIRIYTKEVDGKEVIIYMVDSTLRF